MTYKIGDIVKPSKKRMRESSTLVDELNRFGAHENTKLEVSSTDGFMLRFRGTVLALLEQDVELVNDDKLAESNSNLIDKQPHYTNNGIQPIEIMKANFSQSEYHGFLKSNVLKYLLRYQDKNGLEDLMKAQTYLTWLINETSEAGDDVYWKKNK